MGKKLDGSSVAVVTGASSGVGRSVARALGRRGVAVGLIARKVAALDVVAEEVCSLGGRAIVVQADVADFEQVRRGAVVVEDELGPVDIWINVAMATIFARFVDTTAAEFRRATEVTYLGCVHGTLAALESMRARDAGVIVQVGSALAYRSIPLQAAYCGAKAAIRGFTDTVRTELLAEGSRVRITMVHLPALNTPQFDAVRTRLPRKPRPVAPVYEPDVAAAAIVWSCEHRRRELWVGHSTVAAILGSRVAPGLLDRYLARTGIAAQQTPEPQPPRADYLFDPLPGDPGERGRFGAESRERSLQLALTTRRRLLLIGGTAVATAGFLPRRRGRKGSWPRS